MSPRRRYLLTHPFIFAFAIGIFLAGLELSTFALDPQLAGLPSWVRLFWHLVYTMGGLTLALGIIYRSPALEGVGLNLLSGAFFASAWISIQTGPLNLAAPGATFLLLCAVGLLARFLILLKYMRRGRVLPRDLLAVAEEGLDVPRRRSD